MYSVFASYLANNSFSRAISLRSWASRLSSFLRGSTLITQAFYQINYPILPNPSPHCDPCQSTHEAMRDYRLFVPRDFDVSPYFSIVKPTIEMGFNFHEDTGLTTFDQSF